MNDQPCCAHLKVEHKSVKCDHNAHLCCDSWKCVDCGCEFIPAALASHAPSREEIEDATKGPYEPKNPTEAALMDSATEAQMQNVEIEDSAIERVAQTLDDLAEWGWAKFVRDLKSQHTVQEEK